jgi:hypothetical protein
LTTEEQGFFDVGEAGRGEWVPPIGAMGGPPAHELYRDLVNHAGLRLLRDDMGMPWVEILDGEHRRVFPVPSLELRAALDRFRMRRNLRPVPETDINEFARVVVARASDPDVELPLTDLADAASPLPTETTSPEPLPAAPEAKPAVSWAVDELDHLMHEVDSIQGRATDSAPGAEATPAPTMYVQSAPLHSRLPHRWHMGVSGGRRAPPSQDARLPRYVRALRELVQDGTWIGTIAEIAHRTGDDTSEVFSTLLQFHTDLVGNNLVVAPVEVEEGWRWLVVDRGRLRPPADGTPPSP